MQIKKILRHESSLAAAQFFIPGQNKLIFGHQPPLADGNFYLAGCQEPAAGPYLLAVRLLVQVHGLEYLRDTESRTSHSLLLQPSSVLYILRLSIAISRQILSAGVKLSEQLLPGEDKATCTHCAVVFE